MSTDQTDDSVTLQPIGYVHNAFSEPVPGEILRASESEILLHPCLTAGLEGLEPGHPILILFYFHRSEGYDLTQHPRGDQRRPKRGVFSLRSPRRPNPIGLTEVKLLAIEENLLRVAGLDAIDGTPVLDIKPVIAPPAGEER
jgi:tRNA-Thr(GGU) m(6)t(6)A37 methyltransferase TsaA